MNSSVEIKYYAPHIDSLEIPILSEEMSRLGRVRVREVTKELGGNEVNIWIVVQWIGLAVASGIIQHLTSKTSNRS